MKAIFKAGASSACCATLARSVRSATLSALAALVLIATLATLLAPRAQAQTPGSAANASAADLSYRLSFTDTKLQLQYRKAVNDLLVLDFGGSANLSDLKAGQRLPAQPARSKDAFGLFIAPGYAFGNSWLGYGKLAYQSAHTEDPAGSSHLDGGYGFGFGVQTRFGKNWFGQAEFMLSPHLEPSPASDADRLKSSVFSLSAGFRF